MSGIFTATERVVAPKLPAQWIRSATFALQISFFDGQTINVRARAADPPPLDHGGPSTGPGADGHRNKRPVDSPAQTRYWAV
jgi:hypothetical protein